MKPTYPILFLLIIFSHFLSAQKTNEVFSGCGTDQLLYNDEKLLGDQKKLDLDAYTYISTRVKSQHKSLTTYTIPVVVHIVHQGGSENISDAQVQTAIANFNTIYSKNSGEQIQFCLAQTDPNGNPTTGITRNFSSLTTETMEVHDIALKDLNRWPPTCYLNIWIVKEILSLSSGSGVAGYAYFPSAHGLNMDGLVIEAQYFGVSLQYDAIGAHEVGHYFGLYHTFEGGCSNFNCLQEGDNVCDTPPDQTTFASCIPPTNSCSTDADDTGIYNPYTADVSDNSENYMDYATLSCYNNFTGEQYFRMNYFLANVRSSLLNCNGCGLPCPAPVTANITTPSTSTNITTTSSVNFVGTVSNSSSYQWYLVPNTILSNNLSFNYTFNSVGNYWMKFRALSSNNLICNDGVDSVLIVVTEPSISSCAGSLELNATNSTVLLPSNTENISATGFTWEYWFKLNTDIGSPTSPRILMNASDMTGGEDITFGIGWSNPATLEYLVFNVDPPSNSGSPINYAVSYKPPGGFVKDIWYHAAGVMDYNNHISKLFLNGQLVGTLNQPLFQPLNSSTRNSSSWPAPVSLGWDAAIGGSIPAPSANLDEVRVWKSVRSDAEILSNYNTCLTGNETNLLVYYRLNQTTGSLTDDATTNQNDGTIKNGATWSTQEPVYAGSLCSAGCSPCAVIVVSSDTVLCLGTSATLTASGATTYSWLPTIGLNTTTGASVIATPTITTTYTVIGTNSNCNDTATVTVVINNTSSNTLNLGSDISLCLSGTHTFDAGPGFKKYTWQDGSADQTFTAFGVGKYWVTVKNFCSSFVQSDTALITLAPTPTLELGNDTIFCSGESLQLNYSSTGIFSTFQWSPASGLSCTNCANPVARPLATTKYYLSASTSEGCTNMDSISINIKKVVNTDSDIQTANIFSPNNDGINDLFKITTVEVVNCKIYNRWGLLMFESTNPNNSWNGKNLKGVDCTDGVYYYLITAKDECGKEFDLKGFIELIR